MIKRSDFMGDPNGLPLLCRPVSLPNDQQLASAVTAAKINPANAPLVASVRGFEPLTPGHLAVLTGRYWRIGDDGKPARMTVGWLDNPDVATRRLILEHANLWGRTANVEFVESSADAVIRVARAADGYWSYLGTDCLHVRGGATMNLQGFTERTPAAEYLRVVCHEFGHAMGFPHGHSRASVVARLDPAKVIAEFRSTQGWSEAMIREQILTPLHESVLWADSPDEEETSIMVYQFSGSVTRDGRPIPGGSRISVRDAVFAATVFPGRTGIVTPPPPPSQRPPLIVDAKAIAASIAVPAEQDEYALQIDADGNYRLRTQPAMEMGLFTPDGLTLLILPSGAKARSSTGTLDVALKTGKYVAKVMHRLKRDTGTYMLRATRILM